QANISGPIAKPEALRGRVQLTKLEAHAVPSPGVAKPRVNLELHNEGPIVATFDRQVVTVQSAKIKGGYVNLTVSGTAGIVTNNTMSLRADGNINLQALETFDPDIYAAGSVLLNAVVTGPTANPAINGRLQLQKASLNMIDAPNGFTDGNGTILFNG